MTHEHSRRACGGTCIYSTHTGIGAGGFHVECGSGLGHFDRSFLWNLCHDRGRFGVRIYLWQEIQYSGTSDGFDPACIGIFWGAICGIDYRDDHRYAFAGIPSRL